MKTKSLRTAVAVLLPLTFLCLCLMASAQEATVTSDEAAQFPQEWSDAIERVPDADRALVIQALTLAGANAKILTNALLQCPDEWLPGAIFLIGNMPAEDLIVVTEEMFLDNLRCAYEVRATFPWAATVSESDFLHYVLPMRVSQEPLENWRGYFLEQLRGRVQSLTTLSQAAIEANRWCGENVGYKPTQRRDQGPFETLASGYGRCEEMMIVYIDACRAIGVPARQAWTPYWGFCDDNHAWTEVMSEDSRWHYAGACEPSDSLDNAWFNGPARRANLVMSVPFGLPDPGTPNIYRVQDTPGARYGILNSIGFYRPSTDLTIRVVDISGNPLPETNVYLSVFNYGALRPIARGVTDENGLWKILAGPGGYFISAGDQSSGTCMPFQVLPGDPSEIALRVGLGAELPPETFWLRFPYPEEEAQ